MEGRTEAIVVNVITVLVVTALFTLIGDRRTDQRIWDGGWLGGWMDGWMDVMTD